MSTVAAEMDELEDNQEPRGIACQRCGCAWLGFTYTDRETGIKRYGYTRDNGKLRIRVRYCQRCGRQVLTHEKLAGKPE